MKSPREESESGQDLGFRFWKINAKTKPEAAMPAW